jgi:hypothetical protein
MTRFLLALSLSLPASLFCACTDDDPWPAIDSGFIAVEGGNGSDAGSDAQVDIGPVLPPNCPPLGSDLPDTLSCTGLYGAAGAGAADKAVLPANRAFAPGTQLWTDGSDKSRWIALPPGTQVDTSNPNGWVFPDGTRIWKEFAFQGKRAETRFMMKVKGDWRFITYKWDDNQAEATKLESGAEFAIPGGGKHNIPTKLQCEECHIGSADKVLGFQHVLLGLPGATGFNLTKLVEEKRLTHPPARTSFVVPDDGTGMAAQALPWLHANCGVSCHNENARAKAYTSKMFLRIDPATLDAATTADWNIVKLTVGMPTVTPNFSPGTRIIKGDPDGSTLVQLAQTRGSNRAMPPLGTNIVDLKGLAVVREWISRLGGHHPSDGGVAMDGGGLDATVPDAGVPTVDATTADAGNSDADLVDAEMVDGEVADAEVPDAEVPDAEVPDAEVPDAEIPDAGLPVTPPPAVEPPPAAVQAPPPVVEAPVVPV